MKMYILAEKSVNCLGYRLLIVTQVAFLNFSLKKFQKFVAL